MYRVLLLAGMLTANAAWGATQAVPRGGSALLLWVCALTSVAVFAGFLVLMLALPGRKTAREAVGIVLAWLLWCGGVAYGQPVLKGAAVVTAGNSCLCELNGAGKCKAGPQYGDLLPQRFIVLAPQCDAPQGSRIVRMTYLGDMLGNVRSIVIEWQPPQ